MSKTGNTIVNGNLSVKGTNIEFNSDTTKIKDNIIILNSKETSNKISKNKAGIEINRGTSTSYQVVYDESDSELKAGLSNSLKPLSSKEYSDTNISNAETELNKQIYQNDYMNVLPKIGYYQEDTVETISKYNMNYSPETDNNKLAMFCLTADSNNREILYYLGNDGGPYANTLKLYYAYRVNDSVNFTFVNTPIESFINNEDSYSTLFSCGNKWIVLKTQQSNKWYLVHTNYSTDSSNWTYDDIDFCLKNFAGVKILGCRYFPEYDVLTWYTFRTSSLKEPQMITFYVAKIKEKSIKVQQNIDSPNKCIYIYDTNTYSFTSDKVYTPNALYTYNNISGNNNLVGGWQSPGILYDQENQRMIFYTQSASLFKYFRNNDDRVYGTNSFTKTIYYVPNSLLTSYTGTITMLNSQNIDRNKTQLENSNLGILLADYAKSYYGATNIQFQASYDEINRRNYRTGTGRDNNYDKKCFRTNCDDNPLIKTPSFQNENFMRQGDNNVLTISNGNNNYRVLQPDASIWGKKLNYAYMLENDIWGGYSKVNQSFVNRDFIVAEYKPINGFTGNGFIGIEPVSNKYSLIGNNGNGITRPYESAGYSTTVLSNEDSYYSNTIINNTSIKVEKLTPIGSLSTFNYNRAVDLTDSTTYYPFTTNNKIQVGNYQCSLRTIQYNKVGNWYLILVIIDDANASSQSYYKNSYIGIMRRDTHTIKIFDWNYTTKFSNNIQNCIKYGNTRKQYKIESWLTQPIFVDKKTVIFCFRLIGENNSYITRRGIITFNEELTDIVSCKDCTNSGCEIGSYGIFQSARNFTYSKKYGYAFTSVENYGGSRVGIYTQKPLLNSTYESNRTIYSMEDVIINVNCHKYKMYLQSSQGLIAYIPSIPIFLGGYFEVIQNPIAVNLQPNTNNYIYLERDSSTKKLKAYASTTKDIEEGSKQFSRILLARVLTNDANPIETEYYRINTGYNDYTFYHKITINQSANQTIHVYTTENGKEIDHTSSFFVKINSNIKYRIEIKPDLWCAAGTLQNISSNGIIDKNLVVSATPAKLISTNYSYDFKMEYVSSNNLPIYRFGNNYSATYPDGKNYSGSLTPIDQLGIYTNLDSVIHYQYAKPLPDGIKSVFIKLVCKDGEHFLGHFIRDEFDQYGDVYHSKVLGTQENLNLFKRLYDTKEVFTCVTGIET